MQKRERTMMDLPTGFQKAYDMVWYFSNYVLLAKNYLAIYQLKFYLQGLVSSRFVCASRFVSISISRN